MTKERRIIKMNYYAKLKQKCVVIYFLVQRSLTVSQRVTCAQWIVDCGSVQSNKMKGKLT